MKRVVVLISGAGRNLQALIDAQRHGRLPDCLVGVISSRADAPGVQRARDAGLPARCITPADFTDRPEFDAALMRQIDDWAADWVVLAGFMRILTPGFTQHYAGRLLNIHPSLLPRHPGLRTHAAARAAGDARHGATVHFVTEALDGGPRIIQGALMVRPEDTDETLAERVMVEVERRIYPQAVAWAVAGRLTVDAMGRVGLDDRTLQAPLSLDDLEAGF
ncbi:MAG: phosphoribosylglycinamide formyltransferase [Polycyclovorans sp.]|nr:phosphoribosylglycinamide formyltransferase [Polycyclovorans sp.]